MMSVILFFFETTFQIGRSAAGPVKPTQPVSLAPTWGMIHVTSVNYTCALGAENFEYTQYSTHSITLEGERN